MGQVSYSKEFLHRFFGEDLEIRCFACGKTFPNEEKFMEHEHKDNEKKSN